MTGDLPDGWAISELDELLEPGSLTYGIVQPGSHDPDGIRIVRVKDLEGGRVSTAAPMRVSLEIEQSYSRSRVKTGDILLSLVGSVGMAAIVTPALEGWNIARAIARIRPLPEIGSRWLIHCLRGPDAQRFIHERVNTTVQTTLNLRDVKRIPIPVPPEIERNEIAALLSALDEKVESNRQRALVAESILDTIAGAWAELPAVPLREIAVVDRTTCMPADEGDGLVDHFSLPAFDAKRLPDRTRGDSIKSQKLRLRSECVLVSRLNPATNRTWFAVPDPIVTAAASTEFMVMLPANGVELGSLWLAVRDEQFRSELARRSTGTSGSHQRVRPDDLLSVEVPDVRKLDAETVEESESLLRLAHHARVETEVVTELRDSLLPELLSGRLRVPIPQQLADAQ